MCGIAGVIGGGGDVRRMAAALAHRGPDDEGFFEDVLGFRRLSIIDLAGGAQPMKGCGDHWLVFNGEIYNFRELRDRLRERHPFRTASDSEVILHLFEERGPECVQELDGMFAFAVWDAKNRRLFAARDRMGKKPFFYRHAGSSFVFASEMGAIEGPRRIDPAALEAYLALGYIPAPLTIAEGIRKLPPAHRLTFEGDRLQVERYWRPELRPEERPETEWRERVGDALARAVRKRLVADVPVGAFLSGGVDSSIVAGLMSREGKLQTFSIGFEDESFDETAYAREAAARFGTDHREFKMRPNAAEALPLLVARYGEPFGDASCIPTYYLSRKTSEHVKVALSGDGGDELFAGYRRHKAIARMARLRNVPAPLLAAAAVVLKPWRSNQGERVRRILADSSRPMGELFQEAQLVFTAALRRKLGLSGRDGDWLSGPFEASGGDAGAAAAFADLVTYLPNDILTKVDIASMACPLEVRCPFLDAEVVDLALRIPTRLRMEKKILKDAFRDLLPPAILDRRKMGFSPPLASWLRGELRPLLEASIDSLCRRGLLDAAELRRLLAEHLSGAADHRDRLFCLLTLDLWLARV